MGFPIWPSQDSVESHGVPHIATLGVSRSACYIAGQVQRSSRPDGQTMVPEANPLADRSGGPVSSHGFQLFICSQVPRGQRLNRDDEVLRQMLHMNLSTAAKTTCQAIK